jgi:16S rRNA (adenine1518-N6/adenine1519-N6)-dimethyltransferase
MPTNKRNRHSGSDRVSNRLSSLPPPAKHLGQHFLVDPHIAERIIDSLDPLLLSSFPVLEIGPGRMILTRILAQRSSRLILLEKDSRLVPVLNEAFGASSGSRTEIICDDALTFPFDRWDFPYLIVSNLPYNISVPLLMKIISGPHPPRQAVLMFQKEVARRITATFGNKEYGSLSITVSLRSHVDSLFSIRPGSFNPPPKIHSTVLSFRPRIECAGPENAGAIKLARSAFGYRRKTLRNAFAQGLPPSLLNLALKIAESESGLAETRPEQLPPEKWVEMAKRMIEHSPSIFDNINESNV